jgi:hypothetical protein
MEYIYNRNKEKYIRLHGDDKFYKLYQKVNEAKATATLIGYSVSYRLAPNPADLIGSANTIPYVMTRFNIGTSVMAALIQLKIWNEKINQYHQLADDYRLNEIAEKIAARWI